MRYPKRTPKDIVENIRYVVRFMHNDGYTHIEVNLTPYFYEQLLIFKGLPHGLGILSQWGPYYENRPLKKFGPFPLNFVMSGPANVAGLKNGQAGKFGLT